MADKPKHKHCHCGSSGDFTCFNCGKGICYQHVGEWVRVVQRGQTLYACPECDEQERGEG